MESQILPKRILLFIPIFLVISVKNVIVIANNISPQDIIEPRFVIKETATISVPVWTREFPEGQYYKTMNPNQTDLPINFRHTYPSPWRIAMFPSPELSSWIDSFCRDSNLGTHNEQITMYFSVEFCWAEFPEDEIAPFCDDERIIFSIAFEDENTKAPSFSETEFDVPINFDWNVSDPLIELKVFDEDFTMNQFSVEIKVEPEIVGLFEVEFYLEVSEDECDRRWTYVVSLFMRGAVPNIDQNHEVTITASDEVHEASIVGHVVVKAVTTETSELTSTTFEVTTTEASTTDSSTTQTQTTTPITSPLTTPTTTTPTVVTTTVGPLTTEATADTFIPSTTFQSTSKESTTGSTVLSTDVTTEIMSTSTDAADASTSIADIKTSTEGPTTSMELTTIPTTTTTRRPVDSNSIICVAMDQYGTRWETLAGTVTSISCPNNDIGQVTWTCDLTGSFVPRDGPDFSNCATAWVNNIKEEIKNQTSFSANSATEITSRLGRTIKEALEASVTNPNAKGDGEFYGHEMEEMVNALKDLLNKTEVSTVEEGVSVASACLTASDGFLQYSRAWEQLVQGDKDETFTKILNLTEQSGLLLASQLVTQMSCEESIGHCLQHVDISGNSIQATVGFVQGEGINYPPSSKQVLGENSFIKFPSVGGNGQKVVFIGSSIKSGSVKDKLNTLIKGKAGSKDIILNGDMMTLSLYGSAFNSSTFSLKQLSLDINESVEITFLHDQEAWGTEPRSLRRRLHPSERRRAVQSSGVCSFWDLGRLIWSTEGCILVESSQFSTTCRCSHLTNFNMLMNTHAYLGKSTALLVVTYVGIGFLAVRSVVDNLSTNGVSADAAIVKYLQFSLAVTYAAVFFLVDRHFVFVTESLCYQTGVVVHFLLLALFSFIAIQSVMMIRAVCHTPNSLSVENDTDSVAKTPTGIIVKLEHFWDTYSIICHVLVSILLSLIIILATLIADGAGGANSRAYGGDFCWLEGIYVWAFFGPLFCIIALILVACLVLYQQTTKLEARSLINRTVVMFATIGLAWIIGLFQIGPFYLDSEVLNYGFIGLMAIQAHFLNQYSSVLSNDGACQAQNDSNIFQRLPNAIGYILGTSNELNLSGARLGNNAAERPGLLPTSIPSSGEMQRTQNQTVSPRLGGLRDRVDQNLNLEGIVPTQSFA